MRQREVDQRLAEVTRQSETLESDLSQKRQSAETETQALRETQAQLEARQQAIAETETALAAREQELAELQTELDAQKQEVRTSTRLRAHKPWCYNVTSCFLLAEARHIRALLCSHPCMHRVTPRAE